MPRPGQRSRLFRVALRQLGRFRARSLLAIGCAALGVAGAIVAVNYASGGREQVLAQIRTLGTQVIVITAEQDRAVGGRARTGLVVTTLVDGDHRALRRELPQIVRSSPVAIVNARLKAAGNSKIASIAGVESDFFAIRSWEMLEGESFDAGQIRRAARVALLGAGVARDLFGDTSPIGERLFIDRVPFEVFGVLRERGTGLDGVDEDQRVYVPLSAAMRRVANREHFDALILEVDQFQAMDGVASSASSLLRERHRIRSDERDDFRVQNQKALIDVQLASSRELGFYVRWIAFSALLVAGVGLLAISWISVRDRTREIGTRRALGATKSDMFGQFGAEALLLASTGILLGLFLGWALTQGLAAVLVQVPVFDLPNALLASCSALILNVLCTLWPARRAAALDPISALRHE